MRWRRRSPRLLAVVFAVAASALFLGGAVLADGVVLSRNSETPPASPPQPQPPPTSYDPPPLFPPTLPCAVLFALAPSLLYWELGPACGVSNSLAEQINMKNAFVAANNTVISLENYLNITNSEVANLNATTQELLSYFENRAEGIVPYFINQSWSQVIYDEIAIDSGLVPSIEGLELAYAYQQFQDWNATAGTWANAFGPSGNFASTAAGIDLTKYTGAAQVNATFVRNGYSLRVSRPWQFWSQGSGTPLYFNLMNGGTIITANYLNFSSWPYPTYTVTDVTQGFSFPVADINYTDFVTGANIPNESYLQHISPYDLLRLTCSAGCGADNVVEVSGGYAFRNVTSPVSYVNSGAYEIVLGSPTGTFNFFVPSPNVGFCITFAPTPPGNGNCLTPVANTGGNSVSLGSGPGSVVGGNRSLYSYAPTMQGLVNNTLTMAFDYDLTLRALTDGGMYAIPADCFVPFPSDAFPAATNFANYLLNPTDTEVAYLGYLDSVARFYGQAFTNGFEACSDPNLALTYNWSLVWTPLLNITASIYLAGAGGPQSVNGSLNPGELYSTPSTWAVRNIDPTLLYPFDYDMNVPTNSVYAVPANDPLVALLVNYAGNSGYGTTPPLPAWGVPTYLSLYGYGNFIYPSGTLSAITSGFPAANGDAIDITSCTYRGVPENPCNVTVTYFNNYTIGLVHSLQSPFPVPPSGGGLSGITNCGFGALNAWYDSWAGYIGSAVASVFTYLGNAVNGIPIIGGGLSWIINGIGCILAWIVVILLFGLFLYVAYRVLLAIFKRSTSNRSST